MPGRRNRLSVRNNPATKPVDVCPESFLDGEFDSPPSPPRTQIGRHLSKVAALHIADSSQVIELPFDATHIQTLVKFVGQDFFDEGVRRIEKIIARMSAESVSDNQLLANIHPLQVLWYGRVLGKPIPEWLFIPGDPQHSDLALLPTGY